MPTCVNSSIVRARAVFPLTPLCRERISPICASIVCSGLSEVIGSWKMIEMSLPRISRISCSDRSISSWPLKWMLPEGCEAFGYGNSLRIESALTDLPEPDSPTSARHSPRLIWNETLSTASVVTPPWWKATERSRTLSKGWLIASIGLPERLARIERIAHSLADEDQERQHDRDREEAGETEPGRLHVGLALRQQLAERRRAGRQPEPQEVERRQRHHRTRHADRQERHGRNHRVRQQMPEHDDLVRDAERSRRLDVLEIAPAQEFRAHKPDQRHPGKQQQDAEKHEEAGHQHRRQDQQQIERRNRGPYLDETLEQQVDPAAEIALHRAGRNADDGGDDGQAEAEQH